MSKKVVIIDQERECQELAKNLDGVYVRMNIYKDNPLEFLNYSEIKDKKYENKLVLGKAGEGRNFKINEVIVNEINI